MIYLDYHASTPCDPRVVDAMLPHFGPLHANPSSTIHEPGRRAAEAVERARGQVAGLIGAEPDEVVFTAGATESNNLAIVGLARGRGTKRKRIVTTAVEHKSVLGPCQRLAREGFEIVLVPVERDGSISQAAAQAAITDGTLLVSVQAANNEVGTIQPVQDVAAIAHRHGALVHCDAAQAAGKVPFDVRAWGVDAVSLSAHKLYGPQGSGALYVRGGVASSGLEPLLLGGGQERGIRPGTLNVAGIVGMGLACWLCQQEAAEERHRVASLRDRFESALLAHIPGAKLNGALGRRLDGNCSITLPGVDADVLLARLPGLAISTGAACSSSAIEPSPVLVALGLTAEEAYSTLRIGMGRFTSAAEIDQAVAAIIDAWRVLTE